jgi:hypothetical protein
MSTPIQVKPGVSGQFPTVTLTAFDSAGVPIAGNLVISSLKDVTIDNAKDVFTYTTLESAGKLQVPTTMNNKITTNLVVDAAAYFGSNTSPTAPASTSGLMNLSTNGTLCSAVIPVGAKTLTANVYVTGLSPTVSSDAPVWVSPVTFTVTGGYVVS